MPQAAIAVPAVMSAAGMVMQKRAADKAEQAARPLNDANQAAAIAQAQAVQENEARKKELWDIFMGGYENAGAGFTDAMANAKGAQPSDRDYFTALQRAAMVRNMMGIAQPSQTGLAQGMGQQNWLDQNAMNQDLIGSAETLANTILDKYAKNPDVQQQVQQPVRLTDLMPIKPIPEPDKTYPIPPSPF